MNSRQLPLALLHYLIIAIVISLPFWIDWKIILVGYVLYFLLFNVIIGYCPLTLWQYGKTNEGFIEKHIKYLLKLFRIKITTTRNIKLFIRFGIPIILISFAYFYQTRPF